MNKGQKRPLTLAAGIVGVCAASVDIILWIVFYGIGLRSTFQMAMVSIITDIICLSFGIRLLVICARSAKDYVKTGNWGVAFIVMGVLKMIWGVFGTVGVPWLKAILILVYFLYFLCAIFAMKDFQKAKVEAAKTDAARVDNALKEFKKERQNVCPYCGTEMEIGQKECPNCGAHTKIK